MLDEYLPSKLDLLMPRDETQAETAGPAKDAVLVNHLSLQVPRVCQHRVAQGLPVRQQQPLSASTLLLWALPAIYSPVCFTGVPIFEPSALLVWGVLL